jgi:hypothetical protein
VGLYYSPLDWRFPAYFHPREMPASQRGEPVTVLEIRTAAQQR